MQVDIKEDSWIAKIAARKLRADKVAIVFGKTVHLYNTTTREFLHQEGWVCHELKHVQQYSQYGFIRFIFLYLIESIKKGYYNNKFEVEARNAENDKSLLQQFHFSPNCKFKL